MVHLISAVEERKIALKKVKKGNTDENIKKNYRIKRDKAKAIITKTKTSSWTNFINCININTNKKTGMEPD